MKNQTVQSGFGIIESLIVAGIVAASMLGLGVGFKKMQQTRVEVRAVSTALALEAALQAAIQDASQYTAIQTDLAGSTSHVPHATPSGGLTFQLKMTNLSGAEVTIPLPIGQHPNPNPVRFDENGMLCTGPCSNYAFEVRVAGRRVSNSPFPVYAMAYHISFNSNDLKLANLGTGSPTFLNSDYKWMIPLEAYQYTTVVESCVPGDTGTLVTGIDRETKKINCMKVGDPSRTCAANEVATGWQIENVSGDKVLTMSCRALPQFQTCPSLGPGGFDYVMQRINPESVTTGSPSSKCIFIATRESAAGDANLNSASCSRSATFDVCPQHYTFVPASGTSNGCDAPTIIATFQGWRDQGCASYGAGWVGNWWVQDVNPAPLTVSGVISPDGRQVTCTLNNDQQTLPGANNWAGYEAQMKIRGKCVLAGPEDQTF